MMTTQDKDRIEKHKDSIEESLEFKFRMSNGFFIYKNSYFKTLWRMLAFGLEDTGNADIVDTLSVVNRPLSCVAKVMDKERESGTEKYPEYDWFKEARNSGLYEKTNNKDGRLVAIEPFVLKGVSISIGDIIVQVKSSTGAVCGAIIFQEGRKVKSMLPNDYLFPIGYIDSKTPIKFVSSLTSRTYSTKKKIAYVDTKMLPLIKNGIIVGVLKRFISSPRNEIVFARLIAMNPALIRIKTFTINGITPPQLLTKHFDTLAPKLTKDIIGDIIDFYGRAGRPLPECWQAVVLSENIKVNASARQIAMLRTSVDAIFEQESGFDLVLRDTGTDKIYRYTSVNKNKDIGNLLSAMRMYPAIKDVLRKIPVLAQHAGLEKILDSKTSTAVHPDGHMYKTGNNKIWIDYDAGILGGTLEKPFSSSLSRLLSPSSSSNRKLLKRRFDRLGKLLENDDDIRTCILIFAAMEVCIVMSIPFSIRFSKGTQYTRNAIVSALSSQAYMPAQLSVIDPRKVKVVGSAIAYGEESDVVSYPYNVIFDDYKPDVILSTDTPSSTDRSITNSMKGVTIVSHHAYLISEVFREIASGYKDANHASLNIADFNDVIYICDSVFSSLFEEI